MAVTIYSVLEQINEEVCKVFMGKEDIVRKVLMSILADGHILLDDVPGVGKTTLAVAMSKVLGLDYHRIQFTPDVLPSDIVGFSMYRKETGEFTYMPGTVNDTNLLLADEINRTSSRTQAALLEAMEERQVTVDGVTRRLKEPFIVIATQNQVGTAGTQQLPHAQLDRFLVKLSIGYPDKENQKKVIVGRQVRDPYAGIKQVTNQKIIRLMQDKTLEVTMKDSVIEYITDLIMETQKDPMLELGVSPRGAIAVSHMAKACALMHGRQYATAEDVQEVFLDVCSHRVRLGQRARSEQKTTEDVLMDVVMRIRMPFSVI